MQPFGETLMLKLTSEQLEKYVENGGVRCPNCDSSDICMETHTESDDIYLWKEVECEGCGAKWVDEYRLCNALQPEHWFLSPEK